MKARAHVLTFLLLGGSLSVSGSAAELPEFFDQTLPEHAATDIVSAYAALQDEEAALDARTRELISLGVAAQIPCAYCVHTHASKARQLGASEAEVREAVAVAGFVRLFSTVFHGNDYDYERFVEEYDRLLSGR